VADAQEVVTTSMRLLMSETASASMGAAALSFADHHRGATARTVGLLRHIIH
jgi:3-deoxy-D-manno-octulosonic-acid transferase